MRQLRLPKMPRQCGELSDFDCWQIVGADEVAIMDEADAYEAATAARDFAAYWAREAWDWEEWEARYEAAHAATVAAFAPLAPLVREWWTR